MKSWLGLLLVFAISSLLLISCGGGGGNSGGGSEGTIVNDWYASSFKITFNDNGTYVVNDNVMGEYIVTESGTYSYDSQSKMLHIYVDNDFNGNDPFGNGNGDTTDIIVISITSDTLILDDGTNDGGIATTKEPILPVGDISDDFSWDSLDDNLWYIDIQDNVGKIEQHSGEIYISTYNDSGDDGDTELHFRSAGYNEIQADLKVSSNSGNSNLTLNWSPFGILEASIGIHCKGDNLTSFVALSGEVYDSENDDPFWEEIGSINFDTYNSFEMTWNGTQLKYFINGTLVKTYNPLPSEIENDHTRGIELQAWANENGGNIEGYIDNFYAKTQNTVSQSIIDEAFDTDPNFSSTSPSNIYWNQPNSRYNATVNDDGNPYWGHKTFETISDESFTLEFDINPFSPSWGSYPGIYLSDSSTSNPFQDRVLKVSAHWSDAVQKKFFLSLDVDANKSSVSPEYSEDTWYHHSIEFNLGTNKLLWEVTEKDSGNIFHSDEISNVTIKDFNRLSLGFESDPDYGDWATIIVDTLKLDITE